jgi:hypothetical protein
LIKLKWRLFNILNARIIRGRNCLSFASTWVHRQFLVGSVLLIFLVCYAVLRFYVLLILILYLVCPMLPVSLDCPFLIAPSVFSNVYYIIVSEWLLFNANSAIFSYIMARTSYFSMRWWWGPLCTRPTRLVGLLIVLAHWNNSLQVDMSPHTDTLFWFQANQSLLFLLNAVCLEEKQQIPISKSLVWPDRGTNPRSTTLEASMLTITPSMQYIYVSNKKMNISHLN